MDTSKTFWTVCSISSGAINDKIPFVIDPNVDTNGKYLYDRNIHKTKQAGKESGVTKSVFCDWNKQMNEEEKIKSSKCKWEQQNNSNNTIMA